MDDCPPNGGACGPPAPWGLRPPPLAAYGLGRLPLLLQPEVKGEPWGGQVRSEAEDLSTPLRRWGRESPHSWLFVSLPGRQHFCIEGRSLDLWGGAVGWASSERSGRLVHAFKALGARKPPFVAVCPFAGTATLYPLWGCCMLARCARRPADLGDACGARVSGAPPHFPPALTGGERLQSGTRMAPCPL